MKSVKMKNNLLKRLKTLLFFFEKKSLISKIERECFPLPGTDGYRQIRLEIKQPYELFPVKGGGRRQAVR